MLHTEIICDDAITWLNQYETQKGDSYLASLPDVSEFSGLKLEEWKKWFIETATLILNKTDSKSVTIFYQTDIKYEGEWVDKAFLCQLAAHQLKIPQLFHKVICRIPPGKTTFGRPSYSHILAFSKELKIDTRFSTPDVLPNMGEKTWERGMGIEACLFIADFLKKETKTLRLIHPFCGEGLMLKVANKYGFDGLGIEKSRRRANIARSLVIDLDSREINKRNSID